MDSSLIPKSLFMICLRSRWSRFWVPSSFSSITWCRVSSSELFSKTWFKFTMFLKKFFNWTSDGSSEDFGAVTFSGQGALTLEKEVALMVASDYFYKLLRAQQLSRNLFFGLQFEEIEAVQSSHNSDESDQFVAGFDVTFDLEELKDQVVQVRVFVVDIDDQARDYTRATPRF